ncbi:MAG: hypothetical protein OQK51_00405 [Kangiellaceae bacterium]|nr:hypothetical protein [Kangiellaceae bacterium]
MEQIIAVSAFVVVLVGLVKWAKKWEKVRSEATKKIAINLGFDFEAKPDLVAVDYYQHFQLFQQGSRRRITDLMSKKSGEDFIKVFRYQHAKFDGDKRRVSIQRIVSFTNFNYQFPEFDLKPEHIFHEIGNLIGYQDIDFVEHPSFSKKYLLQGRNERAIRKLFAPGLLEYIENREGIFVEARGNTLIFYREYYQLEPEQITDFLQEAKEVYREFCKASVA